MYHENMGGVTLARQAGVWLLGVVNISFLMLGNSKKSALALHGLDSGHSIKFQDTEILYKSSSWGGGTIMDSLEISIRSLVINREDGVRISTAWVPAYDMLKPNK